MSIYEHTYIATPDCKKKDIDNIDDILLPNIENFLSAISNTHFTLEEIINGDFWKIQKGL